ncbi:MAG: hypothetical protein A2W33_03580 [Chloroflexi bacterium RBG_16_52_11]|nr:MAG: hypothetical protein A2W33_03580 [Chloroflexi bacterium RBG_16_52_11]
MPVPDPTQFAALTQALSAEKIEVRTDFTSRLLYSTDASIYQIEPLGVVIPKNPDELVAAVALSAQYQVPLLARGSGSSLAGQAIGAALILDCSRYLNRIIELDPEAHLARVEPGVILNTLNMAAAKYGLQFGPDPASAERATLGGCIANNATGAHSISYGMAADHLVSAETILADGSLATFSEITLQEAKRRSDSQPHSLEADIYRACLTIREGYAEAIQSHWPRTWRRAAGYNLNYLLPWTPGVPPLWDQDLPYPPIQPGAINLAPLLAGSEGTLGVIRQATLRLVTLPKYTCLGVLAFASLSEACDAAPAILERSPSAIELIPQSLIRLARSVPAYAPQLDFIHQLSDGEDPAALLVVEFCDDDPTGLRGKVGALGGFGETHPSLMAETPTEQKRVWNVRKMGLGILSSRPGDIKSVAFIEDISVPVENLGEFVREMERIQAENGISGDFYAHASAGCLHVRPLLNIKLADGRATMRRITAQAVDLALRLKGSISGEHGVGLSRTEWLPRLYGNEVIDAFRLLKDAADPHGIINPGKILDGPAMDVNLRYGENYHASGWSTTLDFSHQGGLVGAIELCNGAGVCRKSDGVMCPSFQAVQEEMHSTRGRANLLRALISGRFADDSLAEKTVYEALDLCLACKGCRSECPSAVDIAKLRYEFLDRYYQTHPHRARDYLFGRIDLFARLGWTFRPIANPLLASPALRRLSERWLGLAAERVFPTFHHQPLRRMAPNLARQPGLPARGDKVSPACLFLSDAFTEYLNPETGWAALQVLLACGYRPVLLPVIGAGRTLISKGFLGPARRYAMQVLEAITKIDPQGKLPVIGVEPSEIYTLRDEYLDLLPGNLHIQSLAERAFMIDEFLVRPDLSEKPRLTSLKFLAEPERKRVFLHGHCYQKAQPPAADGFPTGTGATLAMLQSAGYQVSLVEAGCCGMAGSFGYEAEHYQLSLKIGELALFPALRAATSGEAAWIAASGVSCQAQIEDGVGQTACHPIDLVFKQLVLG